MRIVVEEVEGLRAGDRFRHYKTGDIEAIAGFIHDAGGDTGSDPGEPQAWLVVHHPTGEPTRQYGRPLTEFVEEVDKLDLVSGKINRVRRFEPVDGVEPPPEDYLRSWEADLLAREQALADAARAPIEATQPEQPWPRPVV